MTMCCGNDARTSALKCEVAELIFLENSIVTTMSLNTDRVQTKLFCRKVYRP
jgi:hypothetical protein